MRHLAAQSETLAKKIGLADLLAVVPKSYKNTQHKFEATCRHALRCQILDKNCAVSLNPLKRQVVSTVLLYPTVFHMSLTPIWGITNYQAYSLAAYKMGLGLNFACEAEDSSCCAKSCSPEIDGHGSQCFFFGNTEYG